MVRAARSWTSLLLLAALGCAQSPSPAGNDAAATSGGSAGGGGGGSECPAGLLDCNANPSDGCEVTAASDAKHCGKCGRDCAGGVCTDGTCGIGLLAEGDIDEIAVDDTDVYFNTHVPPAGRIAKVPKRGGSVTVVVDDRGGALAVDDDSVFFTGPLDDEGMGLFRAAKAGGVRPQTMAGPGVSVPGTHLALDATGVYYTVSNASGLGGLMRAPKAGGTSQVISSDDGVAAFGTDTTHVYWLTCAFEVYARPLAGGAAELLAALPDTGNCPVYDLPVDGERIYFGGYYDGIIHAVPIDGSPTSALVTDTRAENLTVGHGTVYWSERFGDVRRVRSVPTTGGEPATVSDDAGVTVRSIVADDGAVYWSEAYGSSEGALRVLVR